MTTVNATELCLPAFFSRQYSPLRTWSFFTLALSLALYIVDLICFAGQKLQQIKEPLLASKALPVLGASYYFCACSDLSLLDEVYDFSAQAEV